MKLSRSSIRIPTGLAALLAVPLLCGANDEGCGSGDPISIGSDGTAGGAGSAQCDKTSCGPALGMPNYTCSDGTVAGPTGNCIPSTDGQCGWEVVTCPPTTSCDTAQCGPEPGLSSYVCPDGSIGGFTGQCLKASDGSCGWEIRGCPPSTTCEPSQCGPEPAPPAILCDDGSIGGFTGQCIMQDNGTCGWEIRQCPSNSLTWWYTCGDPVCDVTSSTDDPNIPNCTTETAGSPCATAGQICELVDSQYNCNKNLQCAATDPTNGGDCPVSRAKYKNGIEYVDDAELTRVHDELVQMKLARWHYNGEQPTQREHFGFIIDDDPTSPAVAASGDHVDLYGYTSMTAAALQVQAKRIEALEREVQMLRDELRSER